jgi:hypothetical protein
LMSDSANIISFTSLGVNFRLCDVELGIRL